MPRFASLLRAVALSLILASPGGAGLLLLWLFGRIDASIALAGGVVMLFAAAALGAWALGETGRYLAALRAGGDRPWGGLLHFVGLGRLFDGAAAASRGADAGSQLADQVLDGLPVPLLLLDAERRVARINRAAVEAVGKAGLGRDLTATLRHPALLQAVDAVLAGEASQEMEFSLAVPVERHYAAYVGRLAGDLPGAAAIVTLNDVTVARRGETMRADFVANASHELRTPLATLLGFVETLRGPAKDDESARERFLGIMHDQATRMTRLVNDLLSLSRIEMFEHTPPTAKVDMPTLLRSVTDALKPQAQLRGMRIDLSCSSDLPPAIGEDDQLAQVFQNLVMNAIRYARPNTPVTVKAWHQAGAPGLVGGQAGAVTVAVIDQGDGIERRHLSRLTERFYRVDAARSRQLGGTGLGLAIVKHIVSRHRGALNIESEAGVGSEFTVYLPAAANPLNARISAPSASSQNSNNSVSID
jgi:two-component system phosphate regulon sensor histidine kinase PhoR